MNENNYATEAQLGEILGKVNGKFAKKDGIYPDLVAGNLVDPKAQGVLRSIQFDTAAGDASINDDGTAVIQSIHGNTENPNQIASDTGEFNKKDVMTFGPSGNAGLGGTTMTDKIVGGTINWNQLADIIVGTVQTKGVTFTAYNDGRIVANGTATDLIVSSSIFRLKQLIIGHVYLLTGGPIGGSGQTYDLRINNFSSDGSLEDNGYGAIRRKTYAGNEISIVIRNGYNCQNLTFYPGLYDLTQMFGPAIADYVYSLELATAGAGVAWFKKYFPKPYYEYNAGELMSVCTNEHITRGFNQWDEEWENGAYNIDNGMPIAGIGIRMKNYMPVVQNTSYYMYIGGTDTYCNVCYYDENKSFISSAQNNTVHNSSVFTVPNNCKYIRCSWQSTYGTIYNHDICINLSDPSRNGEYEPYTEHRYPLSPVELRGIPKLDASNNLYFDGDTYEKDGTVTRKYIKYTITGNEAWAYGEAQKYFGAPIVRDNGGKRPTSGTEIPNAILIGYKADGQSTIINNLTLDKEFFISSSGYLGIRDLAFDGSTLAQFKQSLAGKEFIFELATPTTETASPFTDPQVVDAFGTEEYVDALATAETNPRDVAIPVGHDAIYNVTHHTVNLISSHKYLFRDKSAGTDTVITGQTTQAVDTGADGSGDILIDLTKWFGAGNEPTSAAALYYIYPLLRGPVAETNVLRHYVGTGVKTVGFNQWDEEWELGSYSGDTGEKVSYTDRIRSKNMIRCIEGKSYYFKTASGLVAGNVYFYDINENYISTINNAGNGNKAIIAPTGSYYMTASFGLPYGTTYNHDICINLSWSGYHNGEYKSYWSSVLDLPITSILKAVTNAYIVGSTEFGAAWLSLTEGGGALVPATGVFYRVKTIGDHYNKIYKWTGTAYTEAGETETKLFPDGMKSAGAAYDEVTKSKAIKRIGQVDLGTLEWVQDASYTNRIYATFDDFKYTGLRLGNATCDALEFVGDGRPFDQSALNIIYFGTRGSSSTVTLYVQTTLTPAQFKQQYLGSILTYELNEPEEVEFETELDLTYRVNDFGTEQSLPEIISVIPNCSMLKAMIAYSTDMTRNLANLSKNAPMSNGEAGQVWTAGVNGPGWANLPAALTPLVITASTTFTQDSKILPTLTATDLNNIYEALGLGRNCVIISNNGQERFVVQQADKISGVACVVFTHYHDSIITYENDNGVHVTVTPI